MSKPAEKCNSPKDRRITLNMQKKVDFVGFALIAFYFKTQNHIGFWHQSSISSYSELPIPSASAALTVSAPLRDSILSIRWLLPGSFEA